MINSKKEIQSLPSLEEYLSWDTFIWNKALIFWRKVLSTHKKENCKAIEIGSKGGGLTLFISYEFGYETICTDLTEIQEDAKTLHKKYKIDNKVKYTLADACLLKYKNNEFDVVILKSVLGSIGKNENMGEVKKAIDEIYRVLKPGGIFLFAENAKGSFLHTSLRKIFRKWAVYWKYFTTIEIESLLKNFSKKEIHTAGVISAFFTGNNLKKLVLPVDNVLGKIIPKNSRYMIYGYAQK